MIQNCTATIEAGTIKGNTAEISGGGIFVYDRSPVIISNTTIEENKATNGSGAGIAAFDSDITLKNEAVISNNDAGFRGGGIFFEVFSNVNCELKMEAGEICGRGGRLCVAVLLPRCAGYSGGGFPGTSARRVWLSGRGLRL